MIENTVPTTTPNDTTPSPEIRRFDRIARADLAEAIRDLVGFGYSPEERVAIVADSLGVTADQLHELSPNLYALAQGVVSGD